jgi:hypothetical protein
MNYQDFKIGNYLTSKTWGGFGKISGIEIIDDNCFQLKISGHIYNINKEIYIDIEPITITEDLLLKIGFDKRYDTALHTNMYFLTIDDFHIIANDECANFRKYDFQFEDARYCSIGNGECDYLHQFQNLFSDIAGKELKMNL